MAEFVQFNVEKSLADLEQLLQYDLLTDDEVKEVVKRRREFEYKLQNVKKSKHDYLVYIDYEQQLLKKVKKRRKAMDKDRQQEMVSSGKTDVNYSMSRNILGLFRKACRRYKGDVDLWLAYINFAKKVNMKNVVSSLFTEMLKLHNSNAGIWVLAAKFEFEENLLPDAARRLLQQALRYLSKSKELWHEYFRMELMYAEKLRKRKEILESAEIDGQRKTKEDFDEALENDDVLRGQIAVVVYQNAVKEIDDLEFAVGFLTICSSFEHKFTDYHKKHIYEDIKNRFGNSEGVWDVIARRRIIDSDDAVNSMNLDPAEKKNLKRLFRSEAFALYEEVVAKIPTEKMWSFYIRFCLEDLEKTDNEKKIQIRLKKVLDVMKEAWTRDLLAFDLFREWILLMVSCADKSRHLQEVEVLVYKAMTKWEDNFDVHLFCFEIFAKLPNRRHKEIKRLFQRGLKKCRKADSDEKIRFWEAYINWARDHIRPEEVVKITEQAMTLTKDLSSRQVAEYFKSKHLVMVHSVLGINETRRVYNKLMNNQPIVLEFFKTMLRIEKSLPEKDNKMMKSIYEDLLFYFGKTDASSWLDYIELQSHAAPEEVALLYNRALKTLKPDESDNFVAGYSLLRRKLTFEGSFSESTEPEQRPRKSRLLLEFFGQKPQEENTEEEEVSQKKKARKSSEGEEAQTFDSEDEPQAVENEDDDDSE